MSETQTRSARPLIEQLESIVGGTVIGADASSILKAALRELEERNVENEKMRELIKAAEMQLIYGSPQRPGQFLYF